MSAVSHLAALCLMLCCAAVPASAAVRTLGSYTGVMTTIARTQADEGRRAEQAGDLAGAAQAYTAAIERLEPYTRRDDDPPSWDLYLVLGSAHLDRARVRAQAQMPGETRAGSIAGNAAVDDDLRRAEQYLERAAALRPRRQGDASFALDLNLGIANGLQGRFGEGRKHLERAAAGDTRGIDVKPLIAEMRQAEKARADKAEQKAKAWRSVFVAIGNFISPKGTSLLFALYDLGTLYRQ
ncbi:MAG TPA: hypothetical protein VHP37_07895 [Burkholderiales bacterium]|nr:hypothetical protein [Burkholderiales bacterium]